MRRLVYVSALFALLGLLPSEMGGQTSQEMQQLSQRLVDSNKIKAIIPKIKFVWVCDPKEKQSRMYRRDLGVVCWYGETYRKTDPGGIPPYMIDYFDQMRSHIRSKTRPGDATPDNAGPAITTVPVPVLRQAPLAPSPKPLDPALLAPIEPGMPAATLREKLGKPTGGATITGSDGVQGTLIYALTDGRTVEFRIENGLLASFQFKGQKPAQ